MMFESSEAPNELARFRRDMTEQTALLHAAIDALRASDGPLQVPREALERITLALQPATLPPAAHRCALRC